MHHLSYINPAISYSMAGLILFRRENSVTLLMTKRIITNKVEDHEKDFICLKSATIIQYTIKGRFMSR